MADEDWLTVDGEGAGGIAEGGAHAAGDFGEVVGSVKNVQPVLPASAVEEVVELRNAVGQRAAAGVAEGNAAVHAAGGLLLDVCRAEGEFDFMKAADAL